MLSSLVAWAGLEMKASARRGIRIAILLVLAVVFTLAAVFHALAAFGEWLRLHYSPIEAQLILAASSLGLALVMGAIALAVRYAPRHRATSREAMALVAAPLAVTLARNGLPRLGFLLPVVVMAGFLAGRWTDK